MKRHLIVFVLASIAPGRASAQSDGSAPLTLTLPASTRALGLGGAFVLSGATADGLFYNPALINTARGFGIDVQRYRSTATLGTLAVARALGSGGLAMGVQVLSFPVLGGTVVSVPDNAEALLQNGPIGAAEFVATLGYAQVIKGFRVGIAAKVIEQRIGNARDGTVGFDIGIVRRFVGITWGISGQNIGPGLTTGTDGFTVHSAQRHLTPNRCEAPGASKSSRAYSKVNVSDVKATPNVTGLLPSPATRRKPIRPVNVRPMTGHHDISMPPAGMISPSTRRDTAAVASTSSGPNGRLEVEAPKVTRCGRGTVNPSVPVASPGPMFCPEMPHVIPTNLRTIPISKPTVPSRAFPIRCSITLAAIPTRNPLMTCA